MSAPANQQAYAPNWQVRSIAGRDIVFDSQGFLRHFEEWSESVAEALAAESGMDGLTGDHWRVIRFLREFYDYNRRPPLNNQIKKGTGFSLLQIEKLFPEGFKYGARRIAGLPNPKTCT